MRKLTALLIVRNEQTMLPGCLDSLAGVVRHLVIVDTGSTDGTPDLVETEARRGRFESVAHERIVFRDFAEARNTALALVTTPWVLWIDADERLGDDLAAELSARCDDDMLETADAWRLRLRNHVLGRPMRCRELADQWHLRVFRREKAAFRGEIHEGLVLPPGARIADLEGALDHHTMTDWPTYWRKVRRYTALEARQGSRKRALAHLLVAFPLTFWRQYVRRGCWRDGRAGLVWAATSGAGSVLRDLRRLFRASDGASP